MIKIYSLIVLIIVSTAAFTVKDPDILLLSEPTKTETVIDISTLPYDTLFTHQLVIEDIQKLTESEYTDVYIEDILQFFKQHPELLAFFDNKIVSITDSARNDLNSIIQDLLFNLENKTNALRNIFNEEHSAVKSNTKDTAQEKKILKKQIRILISLYNFLIPLDIHFEGQKNPACTEEYVDGVRSFIDKYQESNKYLLYDSTQK